MGGSGKGEGSWKTTPPLETRKSEEKQTEESDPSPWEGGRETGAGIIYIWSGALHPFFTPIPMGRPPPMIPPPPPVVVVVGVGGRKWSWQLMPPLWLCSGGHGNGSPSPLWLWWCVGGRKWLRFSPWGLCIARAGDDHLFWSSEQA